MAAKFGLIIEGDLAIEQDEFWLWPESEEPFGFWLSIQTQWNTGMDGRTGLNYPGVEACMRMRRIRQGDRAELFGYVQVMEQAALEEWAKKR